jgi:hypothetical protein
MTSSVLALSMIQPLHGFTFALLHLAAMRMMQMLVPARLAATGQSIYAFGAGCSTAVLTLLSRPTSASAPLWLISGHRGHTAIALSQISTPTTRCIFSAALSARD